MYHTSSFFIPLLFSVYCLLFILFFLYCFCLFSIVYCFSCFLFLFFLLNSDTQRNLSLVSKQQGSGRVDAKLYCFSKLYCFCGKTFLSSLKPLRNSKFQTLLLRPLHNDMKSLELNFVWASVVKYFWRKKDIAKYTPVRCAKQPISWKTKCLSG